VLIVKELADENNETAHCSKRRQTPKEISPPAWRIPSIYIVLYTKNYQKSMTIFGRERGEATGGRKAKKMEDL
jgi:hypothetical protein